MSGFESENKDEDLSKYYEIFQKRLERFRTLDMPDYFSTDEQNKFKIAITNILDFVDNNFKIGKLFPYMQNENFVYFKFNKSEEDVIKRSLSEVIRLPKILPPDPGFEDLLFHRSHLGNNKELFKYTKFMVYENLNDLFKLSGIKRLFFNLNNRDIEISDDKKYLERIDVEFYESVAITPYNKKKVSLELPRKDIYILSLDEVNLMKFFIKNNPVSECFIGEFRPELSGWK